MAAYAIGAYVLLLVAAMIADRVRLGHWWWADKPYFIDIRRDGE
jgi:hypothetical protein